MLDQKLTELDREIRVVAETIANFDALEVRDPDIKNEEGISELYETYKLMYRDLMEYRSFIENEGGIW